MKPFANKRKTRRHRKSSKHDIRRKTLRRMRSNRCKSCIKGG